ncbi:hypothetical protein EI42_04864 [Thermosporothrix hazakensis]|jgi:CheY-like chemotaxis protein|uniref:Response regulatory domain-containing protein n=1 Tax=Thermosporothrix hazakensis TaxID=644383 RepID=A0A326U9R2_THEHA|nr:response regulator transcription factor [Thermosporothrix hazakensis]PZW23939.1 hypothetical protein EI42_04864 [Thermosporothrix hazakensis]GCE48462.1 hypothetical protein KTH_33310 [Thermosporothrix hazakensis]
MSQTQGEKPNVLLIEPDVAMGRLIALGLQHQGYHVITVSSPAAVSLAVARTVDLLILDVDGGIRTDSSALESIYSHPRFADLPLVVLSWDDSIVQQAPISVPALPAAGAAEIQPIYLPKPFDARVLHEAIGQLLLSQAARSPETEERAEELLLAAYPTHSTPSIWPVVTAAGLFLVVVGMLAQYLVALIGVLIVLAALLLWLLDVKPAPRIAEAL